MIARNPIVGGRLVLVALVVLAGSLGGCETQSPKERERLKREIKEELRRELRAEIDDALRGLGPMAPEKGPTARARATAALAAARAAQPPTRQRKSRPAQPESVPARTDPAQPKSPEPEPVAAKTAPRDAEDLPPDPSQPPAPRRMPEVPVGAPEPVLEVKHAAMCTAVEERNPVGEATRFPANGQRLYAFAIIGNPDGPESHVRFVWRYGDKPRSQVRVRVGRSPSWRTWAYHSIPKRQTGDWTVEIQSEAGVVLKQLDFTIEP